MTKRTRTQLRFPLAVVLGLCLALGAGCGDDGGAGDGGGDTTADVDAGGGGATWTDVPDTAQSDDADAAGGPEVDAPGPMADAAPDAGPDGGGDVPDVPDVPDLPDVDSAGPDVIVHACAEDLDCVGVELPHPCAAVVCNKIAGVCVFVNAPVATPCTSGNPCKLGEVCNQGACVGGTVISCNDQDPCTKDFCDPELGGCTSEPWPNCCPTYDCDGKQCGNDGCGGACGTCAGDLYCDGSQCVACLPNCFGYECGPDGCGGTCGECDPGALCDEHGKCEICVKACFGKSCGADGCGGTCGTCPEEWFCSDEGLCVDCLSDCGTKECGPDGCGGQCGYCEFGQPCNMDGTCPPCLPDCTGKQCGDDGCGGTCGDCGSSGTCATSTGKCTCEPDCTDKVCGDNGCGGSCGICEGETQLCSSGHCFVPAVGDHCVHPIEVPPLPYHTNHNTGPFSNQSAVPSGACPGLSGAAGTKSRDVIYTFTPTTSGNYQLNVEGDSGFDAVLYVVTDCADVANTCLGAVDATSGQETMVLWLEEGEPYYLVVDGYPPNKAVTGKFWLDVLVWNPQGCDPLCDGKSCGPDGCGGQCGACDQGTTCQGGACEPPEPGDTCQLPIIVPSVPFLAKGTTADNQALYSHETDACPGVTSGWGAGFPDEVYAFTPPSGAVYRIELTPDAFDATLYVVTDCANISETCVAASENVFGSSTSPENLELVLTGGLTYYLIVDGASALAADAGTYTLTITQKQ